MEKATGGEMAVEMAGQKVVRKVTNPTGKGGFKKGWEGGPGRGKKRPKDAVGEEALADMKAAYSTAEVKGEKPGIAAARKLLHEDYKTFMVTLARLTDAGKGAAVEEAVVPVEEFATVGPKEVAVEELAEKLLAEWERVDSGGSDGATDGQAD